MNHSKDLTQGNFAAFLVEPIGAVHPKGIAGLWCAAMSRMMVRDVAITLSTKIHYETEREILSNRNDLRSVVDHNQVLKWRSPDKA